MIEEAKQVCSCVSTELYFAHILALCLLLHGYLSINISAAHGTGNILNYFVFMSSLPEIGCFLNLTLMQNIKE
jgi:hypothetical protein